MEMKLIHSGRRRPWHLYVVVVLVVAAAAFALQFVGSRADSNSSDGSRAALESDSIAAVDAVNAFAAFATERRAVRDAARNHAYTAEGLRLLAAAFMIISNRESIVDPSRYAAVGAELLDAAYEIERDERATTHANVVRAAFVLASNALTDIQRARYPQLANAMRDLREAGEALRADRPLLSQSEVIQQFFDRASDALRGISEVGL